MRAQDITFAVEKITPAKAERYLEANNKNRKLSRAVVARYAKMIRAGEWMLNGEAIKFNGGDELLDGQHRLRAIVVAQTPVEICVIRGLSSEAFKTFDQGKGRTGGDCLYVLDYKHPNALAAAGRILFGYEMEWRSTPKHFRHVSNDELLATIKRHPKLVDRGHEFMKRPLYTGLVPNSIGMFTYYMASQVDRRKATRFFTDFAGDTASPGDPAYALRQRLELSSRETFKPDSMEKLAWVITAWNAFHAGRELPRIPRNVEEVPRFFPDPVKPQWRKR